MCCGALEEGICLTRLLDPIDDIVALEVAIDHLFNSPQIILEVGINRDDDISFVLRCHEPSHHG